MRDRFRCPRLHLLEFQRRDALEQPRAGAECERQIAWSMRSVICALFVIATSVAFAASFLSSISMNRRSMTVR